MAQRPVKRSVTVLDPMFAIPAGTDEFRYSESDILYTDDVEQEEGLPDDFVSDGSAGTDEFENYSEEPDAPGILAVISQTLRTSASGSQVVDMVIEVEDIEGAERYEVRVTKA